jgi:organic hydroperoxide reductase OsmC/OhrA
MHPFPHEYTVAAAARPGGDVPLSVPGARVIESAPPKEFDGPGNQWSPEQLLTAAVADCFVLGFRAIATASKFHWLDLHASTRGTLDKVEGVMRFTRFNTHASCTCRRGRTSSAPSGCSTRRSPPAWSRTRCRASATCRWRSSRADGAWGTPRCPQLRPRQSSIKKLRSCSLRLGWRSLRRAFASI